MQLDALERLRAVPRVDVLLRGAHILTRGERELIATYVSAQNDCQYCQTIHGAVAAHHLHGHEALVVSVKVDPEHAQISDKLKALLTIAAKTAKSWPQLPGTTTVVNTTWSPTIQQAFSGQLTSAKMLQALAAGLKKK